MCVDILYACYIDGWVACSAMIKLSFEEVMWSKTTGLDGWTDGWTGEYK